MLDNPVDNMVIARLIQKFKINAISNGRITNAEQLQELEKNEIYGVGLYSQRAADNIFVSGV
jgi:hypothetical protein